MIVTCLIGVAAVARFITITIDPLDLLTYGVATAAAAAIGSKHGAPGEVYSKVSWPSGQLYASW